MNHARIICGDVRDVLSTLPAESVQCVVTSPPYWGLRDYGHEKQLGTERTYPEYVENMVGVFRAVSRVLCPDGVLWLNLGDCYATGAGSVGECLGGGEQGARWAGSVSASRGDRHRALRDGTHSGKHTAIAAVGPMTQPNRMPQPGLKPKDLVGIPWRVAFALQADGWWLRADNIWHKPNPMPSSVEDRTTMAHEYVFHLTKSEQYFYDKDAIAEETLRKTSGNKERLIATEGERDRINTHIGSSVPWVGETRNKRSVWTIAPQGYRCEHFAAMPEELADVCIRAGSREGDLVLDPFAGSGTVGVVALRRGRQFLGVELNPVYAELARERIYDDAPLFNTAEVA